MNAVLKKKPRNSRQAVIGSPKAGANLPAENPLLRTVTTTTEITWRSLAAEVFSECGGDKEKAMERMREVLVPGSIIFERLVTPLIAEAVESAVRVAKRDHNEAAWKGSKVSPQTGDRLEALALSLLDTVLPNNVRLRDATAADLKDAAHRYRAQANTMAHKARWLDLIAGRVGTKTVAAVFGDDDAELRRLQKKAEA